MSAVDIFPLSTSAYIADTQHLSLLQDGAYLRIMMTMWRAGGWIDDDDRKLANICKLSLPKWLKISGAIRALLLVRGGKLSQKRLLFDFEKELKRVSNNRQNGSAGGIAKALKNNHSTLATANSSPAGRQKQGVAATLPVSTSDSSSQESARKGSRGKSLPSDWMPSAGDYAYGEGIGFTRTDADRMAEDMKLWAAANSNRSVGRKADWTSTFRGWMRRESSRIKTKPKYESQNGAASLLVQMQERAYGANGTDVETDRALPARHA